MVIECKHVWEHISEYLDGTLDAEVLKQVQTPRTLRDLFGYFRLDAQHSCFDGG
jgi:hypothetical protein